MDCEEYIKRAVAFYKNGELDKTLVNFEAALKIQPDNAEIRQMVNDLKELIATKSQREYCDAEIWRLNNM